MMQQMTMGSGAQPQQYDQSFGDAARGLGRAFGAAIERRQEAVERRRAEADISRMPIERLRALGMERARMHQALGGQQSR